MSDPKIIYAVEGPINPRSGAATLLPALGEPAEVKALRARIHALETALAEISESADCGGTWCAARAGRALEKQP